MRELRNIEIFTEVVNCQSFSKAAKNLFLTPSSVSMSIQKLEGALGVRLLTRTTRQLQLTSDGQAFFDRAQEGLGKIHEAIDLFSSRGGPLAGPLRLSATASIGRSFVLPALPDFMARNPGISIELSLDDHLPDLIKDRIDLALSAAEPETESYVGRYLCAPSMVLVASPAYLAANPAPTTPADLARHHIINVVRRDGPASVWNITERLALASCAPQTVDFTPEGSLNIVESHDGAIDAALAGLGIALVLRRAAGSQLAAGALIPLLAGHDISTEPGGRVFLLYPSRKYLPARVRVFIDFLVETSRRDGWCRVGAVGPASDAVPGALGRECGQVAPPRRVGGRRREIV